MSSAAEVCVYVCAVKVNKVMLSSSVSKMQMQKTKQKKKNAFKTSLMLLALFLAYLQCEPLTRCRNNWLDDYRKSFRQ